MALIHCPECNREVSDQAPVCPGCGYPLIMGHRSAPGGAGPSIPGPGGAGPGGIGPGIPGVLGRAWNYEYKSSKTVLGMPLIHVVYGPAWATGFKPARGFIAIGNIAIGVIAIGGFAAGIFTLAGIGLGLVCIAGLAFGIGVGVGGIATGYLALGGIAIGTYAVGGLAVGAHTFFNDPQMRDTIRKLFHF